MQDTPARTPLFRILYIQVLIAVVLGIAVGYASPEFGKSLKPRWRWFCEAGENDDRADHFLHRRAWHRVDG